MRWFHWLFFMMAGCIGSAYSQSYPAWFLRQGDLPCDVVAGYANPAYYPDSAAAQAFKNACHNYALLCGSYISGGEAFWNIDGHNFWMGNDFSETYDSTLTAWALTTLKPLAVYQGKEMVAVLAGHADCQISILSQMAPARGGRPSWVESLPEDEKFIFSRGAAPVYYYEMSSWVAAEANARRELAKTILTVAQSLQKYSVSMEQIQNARVEARLQGARIVARWRDHSMNLVYVLLRMPR